MGSPKQVRHGRRLALAAAVLLMCGALAGLPVAHAQAGPPLESPEQPARDEASAEAAVENPAPAGEGSETASDRTRLNLLGEINSADGESRRNENVRLTLIDNNVLKELNKRMGATATIIKEFRVDQSYFGNEFGGRPSPPLHLRPSRASATHGNVYWGHNNSILSARSFFQDGDVQPARTNDYGFTLGVPLWEGAGLTLNGSQRKLRGQVNANVLVPTAEERKVLTSDPEKRKIIDSIFDAFPEAQSKRVSVPRFLNANAPQNIDNDRAGAVLDQSLGADDRLMLRYNLTLQHVEAFQIVGGQNPDTTTKNHQARLTWNRIWTATTTTDFSAGFDRIGSLLVPEETSLGIFYRFGRELDSLGPSGSIPIDRAQNSFRYAGLLRQVRGRHTWTAGFELLRRQVNGFESRDHRGSFSFGRDYGRTVIENIQMGTPSSFRIAIGNVHRGFRNWDMQYFAGDDWQVSTSLTLNFGLRYQPVTKPSEVNNLSEVPYDCDCNNFAPRFGFAYRLGGNWGVLRGAYGLHYGEIFPTTFMQVRFNPPGNLGVDARLPDLVDPLKDFGPEDLDPDARSSLTRLAPDLTTPYSHQYNFTWELTFGRDWTLDLGYVGSRSHRLLVAWATNRALLDPDNQTTKSINDRRPDQRYFGVSDVLNGSRGYFDAAKVTLRIPRWAGLSLDASYWFSKALDIGGDYTSTASGRDMRRSWSPSEVDYQGEMKGLSGFDQPHAMLWRLNYETPMLAAHTGWMRKLFGQWQLSSIVLLKSGTPFSVRAGSDAPGFGNVDGVTSDRPNLVDASVLGRAIDHPDTSVEMLPRSAFAFIEPTDISGNLGRNVFRKDAVWNINAGLSRRWVLGGDRSLLFRAESLNFFNHAQFEDPAHDLSSPDFAQITNTLNDGRTFQFTLQFSF